MKELLILRHAKSSWNNSRLKDIERPLNKRGRRDAANIGRFLKQTGYLPACIYCSTARRTRQTLELMLADWTDSPEIFYISGLYERESAYMETIKQAPEAAERIMLIGHNPKIENLTASLLSLKTPGTVRMPTAALLCLKLSVSVWADVKPGGGMQKWLIIPKLLLPFKGFKKDK